MIEVLRFTIQYDLIEASTDLLMIKWYGDSMIEVIMFIFMVGIIATTIGRCLDWVFSGSVDPIYVKEPETEHQYSTITCRVCGHEVRYSIQKMKVDGEVKCDRGGSFLTEETK